MSGASGRDIRNVVVLMLDVSDHWCASTEKAPAHEERERDDFWSSRSQFIFAINVMALAESRSALVPADKSAWCPDSTRSHIDLRSEGSDSSGHRMSIRTHTIARYDTRKLDFRGWACRALNVVDLERLHTRADLIDLPIYDAMKICLSQLEGSYESCQSIVADLFGEYVDRETGVRDGGFQDPPTFRVHLQGCPTVSAFHRDADYGMPDHWLTVWLPLTRVWGNNSLWVQNSTDSKALRPVTLSYGEFLIIDTATTLHGSVKNDSGATRISFDSRFCPTRGLPCEPCGAGPSG